MFARRAREERGGKAKTRQLLRWRVEDLVVAVFVVVGCVGIVTAIRAYITETDKVMIFLLAVVLVAYLRRLVAAMLTAILGVASFNFFFIDPTFTFVVYDTRYWATFLAMGTLGVLVSSLVWQARAQALQRALLVEENYQTELSLESERLRNSLFNSISHDLRTPLASISGNLELLLDERLELEESKRRELLEAVNGETQRFRELLTNLLEMTRIEGGGLQIHRDWHMAEELIGAALHRLRQNHGERRIETRIEAELVYVDETSITTALANLIENAGKYSSSDAPIEIVSFLDAEAGWVVEVRDRGVGLAGVDGARLFEKFYRGEQSREVIGSGLGLSIVKALIGAHKGTCFARARASGNGAVFGFRIPQGAAPKRPELLEDLEEFDVSSSGAQSKGDGHSEQEERKG